MIAALALAMALMLTWLYLLVTRARLTAASEFDRIDTEQAPERWPSVSVVIPARNEADILRFTLPSVLSSYYPQIEVVLVDDGSDDATAEAAEQTATGQGATGFRVLRGVSPPAGWRGKIWALEQGVRASGGEWLLFADADIVFHPQLLRDLVRMALNHGFQMASLMALLRAETFWDRLLLPPFFFFFHLLYPFHRVRSSRSATAAAAGGCVLVERAALVQAGGLEAVRGAWIDDLALASALKSSGARIYLGASVQAASYRRYGTLKSIRQMVARSAFTQLRYSWVLVGVALVSLGFLFGLPLTGAVLVTLGAFRVGPAALEYLLGASLGSSLGFMILAYAPALRLYRLPMVWALTLPAAALVYGAMTVESALLHTLGRKPRWKGRTSA